MNPSLENGSMSTRTDHKIRVLLLLLLSGATWPAVVRGLEDKHADVSIQFVTKGHNAPGDDVLFLMLSKNGKDFWDTDGAIIPDESLAKLLKQSGKKVYFIQVSLENDSLSFQKVTKALDRLKNACPSEGSVVIFVNPEPVYPKKEP
jgi:hypothetical protein